MTPSSRSIVLLFALAVMSLPSEASDTLDLDDNIRTKCLRVLRQGMRGDDFWPSIHAAEGLTLGGCGDEVTEYLTPKLGREKDDQHRCGLARELARAGDRSKAEVMLSILAGETPYGHVHAAESLYKIMRIGDGVAMRRALRQKENQPLKLMAAAALSRGGNPTALAVLRAALKDGDPDTLRIAAWVLGRVGEADDIARIRAQLPRCDTELLRAYLQNSLAALGDPKGIKALYKNLQSADGEVRTGAATFAGDARALDAAETLKGMLDDPHADAAIRAAQSLLVMSQQPTADPDEDISVVVYESTKKNPRYTEGSVLILNDGSLLFAVTQFEGSGSDFATARIVGRSSRDGGRSWGETRILQENSGKLNVMSVTLRRLASGRIAMFYLQKNSTSDLDLLVRFSSDETSTFSEPVLVTTDDGYHVVNNDRIVQLASGRLLAPSASAADVHKAGHFVSHCYISDDDGATWHRSSGQVDAAKRGAMEPEVIELDDGRIMMLVRTQLGFIGKSYSRDAGETWTEMETSGVTAPEAPASLRRIPATGDLLLVWNHTFTEGAGHGGKRTPLTIAISSDEGMSWQFEKNLESDATRTFSYPSLIFTGQRAIMTYWDSGEGSGVLSSRFRSLPVSWLYR